MTVQNSLFKKSTIKNEIENKKKAEKITLMQLSLICTVQNYLFKKSTIKKWNWKQEKADKITLMQLSLIRTASDDGDGDSTEDGRGSRRAEDERSLEFWRIRAEK